MARPDSRRRVEGDRPGGKVLRPRNSRSAGAPASAAAIAGPPWPQGRVYVTDRQTDPRAGGTGPLLRLADGPQPVDVQLRLHLPRRRLHGRARGPASPSTTAGPMPWAPWGTCTAWMRPAGKLLWKKQPGVDYKIRMPIWGIAAAPLVDGELVIVQLGADGGVPRGLGQEDRRRALAGAGRSRRPIRPPSSSSRPAAACWSAGPGDNVVGLESGHRQGPLEVSLPAGADGHQRSHARRFAAIGSSSRLSTTAR